MSEEEGARAWAPRPGQRRKRRVPHRRRGRQLPSLRRAVGVSSLRLPVGDVCRLLRVSGLSFDREWSGQQWPVSVGATYRTSGSGRMSPAPSFSDRVELTMGGVGWGLGMAT